MFVVDISALIARAAEEVIQGRVEEELLKEVQYLDPEDAIHVIDAVERRLADGWGRLGEESVEALERFEGAALPKVAQYVKERLGLEVPVGAEKGWINKVLESLKNIMVDDDDEVWKKGMDEYLYPTPLGIEGVVGLSRLREALKHVPARELLRRVGGSPRLVDFAEAASRAPGSYLEVSVADEWSDGEWIAVSGIYLPLAEKVDEVAEWLLGRALSPPSNFRFVKVGRKYYLYISWR